MSRPTNPVLANTVDPDKAVRSFLAWYDAHADDGIEIRYDIAESKGCDGELGGCCSSSFDMSDLLFTLRGLVA